MKLSAKVQKALIAYAVAWFAHLLFNELVDELARQYRWTRAQVEAAKAVGSVAFALM
jgi:hypothetical protein